MNSIFRYSAVPGSLSGAYFGNFRYRFSIPLSKEHMSDKKERVRAVSIATWADVVTCRLLLGPRHGRGHASSGTLQLLGQKETEISF